VIDSDRLIVQIPSALVFILTKCLWDFWRNRFFLVLFDDTTYSLL